MQITYSEYGDGCIVGGGFGVQVIREAPGELCTLLRLFPVWTFLHGSNQG